MNAEQQVEAPGPGEDLGRDVVFVADPRNEDGAPASIPAPPDPTPASRTPRRRPAPSGARTLSTQLRAIVSGRMRSEDVPLLAIAQQADIDHRVLARFLAGGGLTLGTADRLAAVFGLSLHRPLKPESRPKKGSKAGPKRRATKSDRA